MAKRISDVPVYIEVEMVELVLTVIRPTKRYLQGEAVDYIEILP